MKKIIFLILSLVLMFGVSCNSEKIIIKKPSGKMTVERGSRVDISWEVTEGLKDKQIKLYLLNKDVKVLSYDLKDKGSNDLSIKIPYSTQEGNYRFSVNAVDDKGKNLVIGLSPELNIIRPIIKKSKLSLIDFFNGVTNGKLNGNDFNNYLFKHTRNKKQGKVIFKFNNTSSGYIVYQYALELNIFEKDLERLMNDFSGEEKKRGEFIAVLRESGRFYNESKLKIGIDLIFIGIRELEFVDGLNRRTNKQVLFFREPEKDEIKG